MDDDVGIPEEPVPIRYVGRIEFNFMLSPKLNFNFELAPRHELDFEISPKLNYTFEMV